MRRCVVLAFIFVALMSAQQPVTRDGRFWRASSVEAKFGFIVGYRDGLLAGLANYSEDTKDITARLLGAWPDLTNGEIEEAISRFYEVPENRPFSVSVAIQALALKSKGMPQARIDSFLNSVRQQQ